MDAGFQTVAMVLLLLRPTSRPLTRAPRPSRSAPRSGRQDDARVPRTADGFAAAVLEAEGVPAADAGLVARCLVQAELVGHPSHGMLRLGWYVARIRSGVVDPAAKPETVVDRGRWRCSMGVRALAMS